MSHELACLLMLVFWPSSVVARWLLKLVDPVDMKNSQSHGPSTNCSHF